MSQKINCSSESYIINEDFGKSKSGSTNPKFAELSSPFVRLIFDDDKKKHYIKVLFLTNDITIVDEVTINVRSFSEESNPIFSESNIKLVKTHLIFELDIKLKELEKSGAINNSINQLIIDEDSSDLFTDLFGNPDATLDTRIHPVKGQYNFSRTPGNPIDPYPPLMPIKKS